MPGGADPTVPGGLRRIAGSAAPPPTIAAAPSRPCGLELRAVSKSYDEVQALRSCTFSVARGRLTGFVGPNGAGKTTAMRVVIGLVHADEGMVCWDGRPMDEGARLALGYMPEERGLYPRMRIRDQLVFFGRLSGMSTSAAREAVARWLAALGLAERATARVDELSHGNQQRVQLAAALLHGPDLVVLDEPFSGLDPFAMDSMSVLLRQVARSGAAVLFSSHQLDVVEHLCEDVVVIDSGRVVVQGPLEMIRDASPDRYLDVTTRGDVGRLLAIEQATVVADQDGHIRLRVPRTADPVALLRAVDRDVVRVAYEPPTLSEVFRAAVAASREPGDREATDDEA